MCKTSKSSPLPALAEKSSFPAFRMHYDHLILGGGVAGTTAAETIRAREPNASVAIVSDEPHRLYSRVMLPHVVRGRVKEERVFLKKPQFYSDAGIELLSNVGALSVDAAARRVTCNDGREFSYGKLLIATGGRPRRLECPGADAAGILYFQTLEDARALAAARTGPAAVVGGGFIGMEFLMSFAHCGVPTTAVVRGPWFWSGVLDEASGRRVTWALRRHGVDVRLASGAVRGIATEGEGRVVHVERGEPVRCAVVAAGVGLERNVGFLAGSGIDVGTGVLTDATLAASAPDVYAAGDVAEFEDPISGRRVLGNWSNALLQGKHAGRAMTGDAASFTALTQYAITCFDLPVVFLGATDTPERSSRVYGDEAVLQFFLRGGRVIGATCVGKFMEREAVVRLITSGAALSAAARAALSDPRIPVASLR
jgi:NADPH-dependent 2,4-dienoyl-CoA reductase/sulfur reductase-like enzyme